MKPCLCALYQLFNIILRFKPLGSGGHLRALRLIQTDAPSPLLSLVGCTYSLEVRFSAKMTPIYLISLLRLAQRARTEGDMSERGALSVCQSHLHKYLHLLLLFIHQPVENPLRPATCIWRISTPCQTFALFSGSRDL